jgi:hypothetical protein
MVTPPSISKVKPTRTPQKKHLEATETRNSVATAPKGLAATDCQAEGPEAAKKQSDEKLNKIRQ